jgi:hypothetical protein
VTLTTASQDSAEAPAAELAAAARHEECVNVDLKPAAICDGIVKARFALHFERATEPRMLSRAARARDRNLAYYD